MDPIDVGYRWAADSPRWIFWRGEEVWLCVAAFDGWSNGWICISDWDCPLRPPQSLPTGWSGVIMISSLRLVWTKWSFMCQRFLSLICFKMNLRSAFAALHRVSLWLSSARFMVPLILKGMWWAVFSTWWKKEDCGRCGGATASMFLKLLQKLQ